MTTVLVQYAHGVLVSGSDSSVHYTNPLPSFNPQVTDLPANPLAIVDGAPVPDGPMSLPDQTAPVIAPEADASNKDAPVVSEVAETTKDEAAPEDQQEAPAPEAEEKAE